MNYVVSITSCLEGCIKVHPWFFTKLWVFFIQVWHLRCGVSYAIEIRKQMSHEKKNTSYFPLNPGWLIGILIMVYHNQLCIIRVNLGSTIPYIQEITRFFFHSSNNVDHVGCRLPGSYRSRREVVKLSWLTFDKYKFIQIQKKINRYSDSQIRTFQYKPV